MTRTGSQRRSLAWAWLGGIMASVTGIAMGLSLGPGPWQPLQLLTQWLHGDPTAATILLDVRAPRTLGAWLVGACLSLAGVLLQTATQNPIADPYLVGTSGGATLAAVLAIPLSIVLGAWTGHDTAGWLPWLQPLAALVGALVAVSTTFALARASGGRQMERLLVAGLVVTAFTGAATSFVLTRLSDVRLRAATQWLMGGVALPDLGAAVPALVALGGVFLWTLWHLARLEALTLGDEAAAGLGLDSARWGRRSLWAASILSAVAVSIGGIVGFVGLLVPHVLRRALGSQLRVVVPAAVLVGGGALACLDGACRVVVAPAELPLGILTALAGCPVLAVQLGLGRHRAAAVKGTHVAIQPTTIPSILLENVEVEAGGRILLAGVTLAWQGPALVALVGPNGSGKTTLLRTLAGALAPRSGTIRRSTADLAWLPQHVVPPASATLTDLVALGRLRQVASDWRWRLQGRLPAAEMAIVGEALTCVDLSDLADRPCGQLSGGERQRGLVAMTLAQRAPLVLLDEPTASLDWGQARRLIEFLRAEVHRQQLLAVVALHDLPLAASLADRVVVLDAGRVRADGPADDPAVIAAVADVLGAQWPVAQDNQRNNSDSA